MRKQQAAKRRFTTLLLCAVMALVMAAPAPFGLTEDTAGEALQDTSTVQETVQTQDDTATDTTQTQDDADAAQGGSDAGDAPSTDAPADTSSDTEATAPDTAPGVPPEDPAADAPAKPEETVPTLPGIPGGETAPEGTPAGDPSGQTPGEESGQEAVDEEARADTPMDIRSLLGAQEGAPSLVRAFSLAFVEDGQDTDAPSLQADIAITFEIMLEGILPSELREGDWYDIALPQGLAPAGMEEAVTLTEGDVAYAQAAPAGNLVRLTLLPGVASLDFVGGLFTVPAAFVPEAFAPGQEVTLSLPGEPEAGEVSFTMAEAEEEQNPDGGQEPEGEQEPDDVQEPDDGQDPDDEQEPDDGQDPDDEQEPDDGQNPDDEQEPGDEQDPDDVQEPDDGQDPGDETETPPETLPDGTAEEDDTEDRLPQHLSGEGMVTGFMVTGGPTGQEGGEAVPVTVTLEMTVTPAMHEAMSSGGTYSIELPQALTPTQPQATPLEDDEGVFATAQAAPAEDVVVAFEPEEDVPGGESAAIDEGAPEEQGEPQKATGELSALNAQARQEGTAPQDTGDTGLRTASFTFDAQIDLQALADAGGVLSLPGEPNAPVAVLDTFLADTGWTRTDDSPMNVKDIFSLMGKAGQSILSGFHLTYQEPGSTETSDTHATADASIRCDMSISIPYDVTANMRGGDTYAVQLPKELKILSGGQYALVGPDGVQYATADVTVDGQVIFTFLPTVENMGNATGDFYFYAVFDKDHIDQPGDHVITLPGESQDLGVTVDIVSKQQQALDKKGLPDKTYNAQTITWDVDFNKPMQTLTNPVLTDAIPAGLQLTGIEVYAVDVTLDGEIIPGSERPIGVPYTTNLTTGQVAFQGQVTTATRVRYTTQITADTTAGGDFRFVNNATLVTPEAGTLTTQSTVTVRYGKIIDKRSAAYDPVAQTFSWEIRYNYGTRPISAANAYIIDTISSGMDFLPGTLVVNTVDIDNNTGNPSNITPAPAGSYTVTYTGNEMRIQFNQDIQGAYYITYSTKVTEIVDGSSKNYNNSVTTTWGGSDHSTGTTIPAKQQNIIKSVLNADPQNRSITWKADLNKNRYTLTNWKLTDTLSVGLHLLFPDDMLTIMDVSVSPNYLLRKGVDYIFTQGTSGNRDTFTIEFQNNYATTDHQFEMVYFSVYGDDAPADSIPNTAQVDWSDENGNPHSSSSTARYPRTPVDADNGLKYGVYNAVTKEITWYILANYHEQQFRPAVITDAIGGGQAFVHDSVRLYQYTPSTPDNIGTEIPPGAIGVTISEPNETNTTPLVVTFPTEDTNQFVSFWVVFRTSLVGKIVGDSKTYDNTAVFTANGVDHLLNGNVTVKYGGKLVEKSGMQDSDGYVNWSVVINPSQSFLATPVITDTPSDNQRIDIGSLQLYRTHVDIAGNISPDKGQPLAKGQDYTADYSQQADGTWKLTIAMSIDIEEPYVLEYRTRVFMTETSGQVSNHIHVEGQNKQPGSDGDSSTSVPVVVQDGGGTLYGKPGSLTVRKLDARGRLLTGATLALADSKGVIVRQVTVGTSGEVTFADLPQGSYLLYELAAPQGYTISAELAAGMPVMINDETTAGRVVNIANLPTLSTLLKTDANGNALPGAVFSLEVQDAAGNFVPYGQNVYRSGPDGMVRVYGLVPGTYRLIEQAAPQGYILNSQPIVFTLAPGSAGVDAGVHINYQGSISLLKVDENGAPLAGSVFAVHSVNDGRLVGTFTSDANGTAVFDGLGAGAYRVREIASPPGYGLLNAPLDFTIPNDANGPIPPLRIGPVVNSPLTGGVIFHKFDGNTGLRLAGAVFEVLERGTENVLLEVATGADGTGVINSLTPGSYSLREKTAPAGYIRNEQLIDFDVLPDGMGGISAIDIGAVDNFRANVSVWKVDENHEPLVGAQYLLSDTQGNDIGIFTTDIHGQAYMPGLAPGTYRVREIAAPAGYTVLSDPRDFTIPDSVPGRLPALNIGPMTNYPANGTVLFRKIDSDTGTQLSGAVFEIRTRDGAFVSQVTTDANGRGLVTGLPVGDYSLVEIQAPQGYIRDSRPIPFTIEPDSNGNLAPRDLGTIENYLARVRLAKVSDFGRALPGAVFRLKDSAGRSLGDFRTDTAGVLELYNLGPGRYTVEEITAPAGYVLSGEPVTFTVPEVSEGTPAILELGRVANRLDTGAAILIKRDAARGFPIAGAEFVVIDQSTGRQVAGATSDLDGRATVTGLVPGNYAFVETKAAVGYRLDRTPIPFTIVANAQTPVEVTMQNEALPPSSPGETAPQTPRPPTPVYSPPQTGDSGHTGLYIVMGIAGLLVAASLIGLGVIRRKGREKRQ